MEKNKQKIFHQFIWYMLIFSIIGLIMETIYCYVTTGVLESRKGLILGPVCPIYGVGAVVILFSLKKYKGNKLKLFIMGFLLGCIAEYIISFILESIYGTRFWEYSYTKYHLNGRICVIYGFFWGVLSVLMIEYVKKYIDIIIEKIKIRWIDYAILIFFIIDVFVTVWGINVYMERVQKGRNINENANIFEKAIYTIEEKCFTNKIMCSIFPNIRIMDENGNEIWVKDIINE